MSLRHLPRPAGARTARREEASGGSSSAARSVRRLALSALLLGTLAASADEGGQIVLYSGAINDGSYNESASRGVLRFEAEAGVSVRSRVLEIGDDAGPVVERLAAAGIRHVVALGGWWARDPLVALATRHPETRFTIVDAEDPGGLPPNVAALAFREEEVAAMAGIVAARRSATGRVGFVGGMPIDAVVRFCTGFFSGARHERPDVAFEAVYVHHDPRGFRDRDRAFQLASGLFDRGADVVFGAAGISTRGVLRAANEKGRWAIGVDENQNDLYPGHVLTSALKRLDLAVYAALKEHREGKWRSGFRRIGTAEGMVGLAVDGRNADLVGAPEALAAEVRRAFEADPDFAAAAVAVTACGG